MPCRAPSANARPRPTSGRAAWICEWIANAARLSGQLPSTTSPSVVDEDEVPHADELEVHTQRVDPEMVEQFGIACGDVARHTFVESELPEQAEGGREALLAVPAFVVDVVEFREIAAEDDLTPFENFNSPKPR